MDASTESFAKVFCAVLVGSPLVSLLLTTVIAIREARLGERATNRVVQASLLLGLLASLGMVALLALSGRGSIPVHMGHWIDLPELGFHFAFTFVFDRLSLAFVVLTFVLCGVVGAFARTYLHREAGYRRFYLLFSLFILGMVASSVAATIETLFAGWELVGLSSALLVAFFQERSSAVRNGLRVWTVYRIADAAFLAAALTLHHLAGKGDLALMAGDGGWPGAAAPVTAAEATTVGLLLLVAAAGKSGLVPFSGWLPRAMEGPTPSSAIFYGALSVHLGAFLLLRVSPLLDRAPVLCAAIVALGLLTAVYAWLVGRTQTDIKSALAFASLTQVGLIVAEIGLGLRYVALAHIVGNACLRTLQLLRAPSLLHDYRQLENAIGADLPRAALTFWLRWLPARWRAGLYRLGYDREAFDTLLSNCLVGPVVALLRRCDALERWWMKALSGEDAASPSPTPPAANTVTNTADPPR